MQDASATDVAAFETALTAERVAACAYLAAQRCTTRQVSYLPAAAAPGQPRFTVLDAARAPIAEIAVSTRSSAGRANVTISGPADPGPVARTAVLGFVAAVHRALADLDTTVQETAAAPAHPAPTPSSFTAPPAFAAAPPPSFAAPPPPPPPPSFAAAPPPPPPPPPPFAAAPPPPAPPPPPPPSFAAPQPPALPPVVAPTSFGATPIAPPPAAPPPTTAFEPPSAGSFAPPPAPIPSTPPLATPASAAEDDDAEATVLAPRGRAMQAPWRLRLADDSLVVLPAVAVIGRRPTPPPSSPAAQAVALEDPERILSKSHALLESDAEGIWVTDLDSTNGTMLLPADGASRECAAGERVRVAPGDGLLFAELRVDVVP